LHSSDPKPLPIRDYHRAAKLFEEVFGKKIRFGRARTARTASGLQNPQVRTHRAA